MHSFAWTLLSIAGIWVVAVLTPGPDLLLVTRMAIKHGRRAAFRALAGILVGVLAWGLGGFFGIHTLFLAVPWLYLALKIGGGIYLIFIGVRLLRETMRSSSDDKIESAEPRPATGSFRLGLMTNLANPKAAIFTTSLFAATMPPKPTLALGLSAIALMVFIGGGCFALMIQLLSTKPAANLFLRARRAIDGVAGVIFIAFGARLAWESRS